jgi:phosphopentomutase
MIETMKVALLDFEGLCFVNLVDFDALYGHRRDALGYAVALEEFDSQLSDLIQLISTEDLLIICADHGNDPTHSGSDHTREFVPLLVYNPQLSGKNLGIRQTFADIGATIADNFTTPMPKIGKSFLKEIQ